MKIKIVGFDPAMSNMGIAQATLDLDTMTFNVDNLLLVQTESNAGKTVRKSSDDLRRAKILHEALQDACKHASFAVAEVPTGTQSARGALGNGMSIGVLASCPIPLIEVSPTEAKLASTGCKTSTKGEMIAWAIDKYPNANWLLTRRKGALVPINDNEHLADACAIIEAGIKTPEFKAAISILRGAMISNG
jgi:hypothetical protein